MAQDTDGEGQIVYLFLPLYSRGNLQDAINTHSLNGTHFSESEILRYFRGTCEAVRAMHTFHGPVKKDSSKPNGSAGRSEPRRTAQPQAQSSHGGDDSEDEDERNQMLPEPEGDDEGGFSYDGAGGKGVPLLAKNRVEQGDVIFDGDQELADSLPTPDGEGELVPYAHRDLKPGYVRLLGARIVCHNRPCYRNVMISDDGVTPILMDFGSTVRARIKIETRSQALMQQVYL